MHPSIRYLHTFTTVCQTGSYRAAAERLHLTQPAVAYQVRQLQEWADVVLVEREGRGIRITEAGHYLAAVANQIDEELSIAVNRLRRGEDPVLKQISIGTFESFGRHVLMRLLKQAPFKALRVDLRFRNNEEIASAIMEGQCDLGFVYQQPVSNQFRTEQIGEEELVLAIPASWLKQYRWSLAETYNKVLFVKYDEGAYAHGRWFETFFNRPPPLLLSDYHFSGIEEVLSMVAAERGVSVVSRLSLQQNPSKRITYVRPIKGKRCMNSVYRVERSNQRESDIINQLCIKAKQALDNQSI
jgi:DNA-binding transcriptional LysR family regulator